MAVDAKNAFVCYLHITRRAVTASSVTLGLSDKVNKEEKEKIMDALKDGQSWMDANPEADAKEVKKKHKEVEGICAPIISKYYGQEGGGSSSNHKMLAAAEIQQERQLVEMEQALSEKLGY